MQPKLPVNDKGSLFEEVTSIESLKEAFKDVRKNKGSAGVDGKSIKEFEEKLIEELTQLHQELMSWSYKPMPVRRVEIPKPDGKGVRLLGVPTIRDRVVQASIKRVLEPIIDATFSPNSFGFRPGCNQHQALLQAQKIIKKGKSYVVDIDLSKFFDRINHDRIIERLRKHSIDKKILRLVGVTLRSGISVNGTFQSSNEGSVQGSPLSPLLSNLILDELDKELEKRGLEFCRFADDCNIFVKTLISANRVMASVGRFIETRLKLVINKEKSKVAESRHVKFLGMTITGTALAISKKAMEKAYEEIKRLTPRGGHDTIEKRVELINLWYRGWSNYFSLTQFPLQFRNIEAHIRRRLRARIIGQHRRRNFLYKKFRLRNVNHKQACQAYSHKRIWALSITRAANKAWGNDWFEEELGLFSALSTNKPHWFKPNRRPCLD